MLSGDAAEAAENYYSEESEKTFRSVDNPILRKGESLAAMGEARRAEARTEFGARLAANRSDNHWGGFGLSFEACYERVAKLLPLVAPPPFR